MPIFNLYTEEEFVQILQEHLPMYRGMAMRILKNAADADDAVQTALMRGWTRRFFLRKRVLPGWLARIVINESYTILRKRKREASVNIDAVSEAQLNGSADDMDKTTEEAQMQKLDAAIAALPELYRQTVHIALLSNLDTQAAADLLGCSANTLYQRLHKAKQLLREALKDE